jgi:hypothetical protein
MDCLQVIGLNVGFVHLALFVSEFPFVSLRCQLVHSIDKGRIRLSLRHTTNFVIGETGEKLMSIH